MLPLNKDIISSDTNSQARAVLDFLKLLADIRLVITLERQSFI